MAELLCRESLFEEDGPDSVEDCFDISLPPEGPGCFGVWFDGAAGGPERGCNEYFSETFKNDDSLEFAISTGLQKVNGMLCLLYYLELRKH